MLDFTVSVSWGTGNKCGIFILLDIVNKRCIIVKQLFIGKMTVTYKPTNVSI